MNDNELFIEAHKLPDTLSKEELYSLIDKMNNEGDQKAFDKIIKHNIRLVLYQVMNRFATVLYNKKELVSVGNVGLIKAIRSFDTSKGLQFATYASRCIDNEILMFLRGVKKHKDVSGFEDIINVDKDGNSLNLEDILPSDENIENNYEDKEIYKIIRDLVDKLPPRDKEIITMFFGFNDERRYTQEEIANQLHISQSYVSRLIKKLVKKIGKDLEAKKVIELNPYIQLNSKDKKIDKEKQESGKVKMSRKLQTIYEYFNEYKKEDINHVLSMLTEEEQELIALRYGNDLDNPVSSENYSKDKHVKFYGCLIPKMKRLLDALVNGKKTRGRKKCVVGTSKVEKKQESKTVSIKPIQKKEEEKVVTQVIAEDTKKISMSTDASKRNDVNEIKKESLDEEKQKSIVTSKVPTTNVSNDNKEVAQVTKEDRVKILELLKTPEFERIMKVLPPKQAMIVSLKLGYIDGKYFSVDSIAKFLEMDKQEVIDSVKQALLAYKQRINLMLDRCIEVASEDAIIVEESTKKLRPNS